MSGELVAAARKRKQPLLILAYQCHPEYKWFLMASYFSRQQLLDVHVCPQTLNSSNPSRLFTLQDKFTSSLKTSLWQKINQGKLWLKWGCFNTSCKIMLLYIHYSDTIWGVQVRYPEFKCYEKCLCKCFLALFRK